MDLNEQLLSIRQWLYLTYRIPITVITPPYRNLMHLATEGRVRDFSRPQWTVERLNHRVVNYGAIGYRDDCLWQLNYYGMGRTEVDTVLSTLHHTIQNDITGRDKFNVIPGYRFNWQYPQPDVQPSVVSPGPGLPGAQYSVRVSGLDMCGNESAASIPVLVTLVGANNALRVRILKSPSQVPMFYAYNIYVNNHLEVAGLVQPGTRGTTVVGGNAVYAIAILNSLLGTGVAPKEPANSVPVHWKWIRVNSYANATKEDEEQDGVFDGMVTMDTSVMQERDQPQPDVMRVIGVSMRVLTPAVVPVVSPYLITSNNQVIVNVSAG